MRLSNIAVQWQAVQVVTTAAVTEYTRGVNNAVDLGLTASASRNPTSTSRRATSPPPCPHRRLDVGWIVGYGIFATPQSPSGSHFCPVAPRRRVAGQVESRRHFSGSQTFGTCLLFCKLALTGAFHRTRGPGLGNETPLTPVLGQWLRETVLRMSSWRSTKPLQPRQYLFSASGSPPGWLDDDRPGSEPLSARPSPRPERTRSLPGPVSLVELCTGDACLSHRNFARHPTPDLFGRTPLRNPSVPSARPPVEGMKSRGMLRRWEPSRVFALPRLQT